MPRHHGRSHSRSRSASPSPSRRRSSRAHARDADRRGARSARSPSPSRNRHRGRSRSRDRPQERARERAREREREQDRRRPTDDDTKHKVKDSDRAPKVTEENGEVSMSIEETNRLRISLGLKPLSLGPSKSQAKEVNLQKTSAQLAAEKERAEIQKALQQSRKKRELTQKLAGKSIGEQLLETSAGSALDWVRQSRTANSKNNSKTRNDSKATEQGEQYDAAALAGLTVGHDVDAFHEGQEVVLTLKDSHVLTADGHAVNDADDGDELENVEMSERARRDTKQQRALRASMPVYSGYDDDEFIEMGGAGAMPSRARKKKATILRHYDQEEEQRAAEQAAKFRLDAQGGSHVSDADRAARKMEEDEDGVAVVSLAMNKQQRVDDFFTEEEMAAQFAKKGKKLRKKKKKVKSSKSKRRQTEDAEGEGGDDPDDGVSGDAAALMAQLEAEAKAEGYGMTATSARDRGKRGRARGVERDGDEEEDDLEELGLRRFQQARDKASAAAAEALSATSGMPTKKRMKRRPMETDDGVDVDGVDLELSATLARTRQLAQLRQRQQEQQQQQQLQQQLHPLEPSALVTSEQRLAALAEQTVMDDEPVSSTRVGDGGDGEDVVMTVEDKTSETERVGNVFGESLTAPSKTVVFNNATDFESRLRSAMEQRSALFQAATASKAQQAAQLAEKKEESDDDAMEIGDSDDEEASKTEPHAEDGMNKKEEEEEVDTEEGAGWGTDQPLVATGMGATLALLRRTGELRETRSQRQAGRANDSRDRDAEKELQIKDGVKLDYRDEFGRLLTKKEAFRLLSYKFHGHKPGKKKQEKRLKQLKEELAAQQTLSGEGSTTMMKGLEKKQQHAQQAYVVLSNGS